MRVRADGRQEERVEGPTNLFLVSDLLLKSVDLFGLLGSLEVDLSETRQVGKQGYAEDRYESSRYM